MEDDQKIIDLHANMKRTSHCALHLRARAEHMNNTNAHTAIQNPRRRCAKLYN